MGKKKAITKILSCFVMIAILMSAMPVSIVAMNEGINSTSDASNRSNEILLEKANSNFTPIFHTGINQTIDSKEIDSTNNIATVQGEVIPYKEKGEVLFRGEVYSNWYDSWGGVDWELKTVSIKRVLYDPNNYLQGKNSICVLKPEFSYPRMDWGSSESLVEVYGQYVVGEKDGEIWYTEVRLCEPGEEWGSREYFVRDLTVGDTYKFTGTITYVSRNPSRAGIYSIDLDDSSYGWDWYGEVYFSNTPNGPRIDNMAVGDKAEIRGSRHYYNDGRAEIDLITSNHYLKKKESEPTQFYIRPACQDVNGNHLDDVSYEFVDYPSYKGTCDYNEYLIAPGFGTYKVKFTKGDLEATVTLESHSKTFAGTVVTLRKKEGSIYATSTPSGANAYLDGSYKGTSPLTISNVPVGTHTVKYTKTGYKDCVKTVTVYANQQRNVHCYMEEEKFYIRPACQDVNGNHLDDVSYEFVDYPSYKGTCDYNEYLIAPGFGTYKVKFTKGDLEATVTLESHSKTFAGTVVTLRGEEKKPNLVIESISSSLQNPKIGDKIKFTVKTKNKGDGDADHGFYIYYYINGDKKDSDYVSSLSAGRTKTTYFLWTANKCGNVQVKAVADATDAVDEGSNEGNNERTKTVSVTCQDQPITSIVIEGRSIGCEDYAPLNVFFRGSEIPLKLQGLDKQEYTFVGERWVDRNSNLNIETVDELVEVSDFCITTNKDEFTMKIPENIPIGLYRLKIKGTVHVSIYFWVIYSATNRGLSEEDIQNYWKDEFTGGRVGFRPEVKTSHHKASLMICMASAASYLEYDDLDEPEHYTLGNFHFWLDRHLKPVSSAVPPSDILSYATRIIEGDKPNADCDCFATFGVSLARAAGIPARAIHGLGIESSLDLFWSHCWVEPYYYTAWQVWDPPDKVRFEQGDFLRYNHYVGYIHYQFNKGNLVYLLTAREELGKWRSSDYGGNPLLVVLLSCPVQATITDQYGRIVSDDGTNEIPDADMITTNGTKIFYLPADLTYFVEIDAYDSGTFNFTRFSPIGNDISITKFENIPVTSNTKASVEIETGVTEYTMSIDYNGDGTIDEVKSLDVSETIEVTTPTNIIYVPDDYSTIQQAVNAANSGDTIIVRDGTYIENVDVNKPHLTIKSENGTENCIVHSAYSNDSVFEVTADYVNISGFTVTGASAKTCSWNAETYFISAGICLANIEYCNILNNNVSNNTWIDIFVYYSNNNSIMNNNVSSSGLYFLLQCSNNNNIYLNNFLKTGIYASYIYSDESTNTWNSPSKMTWTYNGNTYTNYMGNYRDDYTGLDANGDGIGDTAYNINSDMDNYPLMQPWENYFGVIAPTISNIKVSPTYAFPGDSINISADVFDSSGIRGVRAFVTKDGEDVRTIWLSGSGGTGGIYTGTWITMIFTEGGIYNITISATNTEGNEALKKAPGVGIPIDTEGPLVSDITVSPTSAEPGTSIHTSAKLYDNLSGIEWVKAIINKGGGYVTTVFMSDPDKDGIYTGTWHTTTSTVSGIYNINISAADNRGNEALAKGPEIEIT